LRQARQSRTRIARSICASASTVEALAFTKIAEVSLDEVARKESRSWMS
jgi:hypothetical protein